MSKPKAPTQWQIGPRGLVPALPPSELLTGKARGSRKQIEICLDLHRQARDETRDLRTALGRSEAAHRRAIADSIRAGEAMPPDPTPGLEAKLAEAERMAAAYQIAAGEHYVDLGDHLSGTGAGAKGQAAASERVKAIEAELATKLAEVSDLADDLSTQRRLREWFRVAVVESRSAKWPGGHHMRDLVANLGDALDVKAGR